MWVSAAEMRKCFNTPLHTPFNYIPSTACVVCRFVVWSLCRCVVLTACTEHRILLPKRVRRAIPTIVGAAVGDGVARLGARLVFEEVCHAMLCAQQHHPAHLREERERGEEKERERKREERKIVSE